jgi:hypothetical protein
MIATTALTEFEEGILFAAAEMLRLHDQPTMVADMLRFTGLDRANVSQMDDYDKEWLETLNVERDIALTGLELTAGYERVRNG